MMDPVISRPTPTYDANPAAAAIVPTPKPAARWEDFIDIFYAPSEVFARRENSGFAIPMLVVTLAGAAILLSTFDAMTPIFDAEFTRQAAAGLKKGATPEMMEKGRAIGGKIIKIMAVIAPPIVMFFTGLMLWVAGKFVGARQTLTAAVMVAAFANVPRLIGSVLGAVQVLVMDPANLTSRHKIAFDLARFLDIDNTAPMLVAIAGRVDVFTIWATVLLAIGLAVTGKIPRSQAALAAGLVWVLGSLPELIGAARQ